MWSWPTFLLSTPTHLPCNFISPAFFHVSAWFWDHSLKIGILPLDITSGKNNFLSLATLGCQRILCVGWGYRNPAGLIFLRSFVGNHSYDVFSNELSRACPECSISQHSSEFPSSHSFLLFWCCLSGVCVCVGVHRGTNTQVKGNCSLLWATRKGRSRWTTGDPRLHHILHWQNL